MCQKCKLIYIDIFFAVLKFANKFILHFTKSLFLKFLFNLGFNAAFKIINFANLILFKFFY